MIKSWSYVEEYKDLRKKILKSIDRTLEFGQIFFGKELQKWFCETEDGNQCSFPFIYEQLSYA